MSQESTTSSPTPASAEQDKSPSAVLNLDKSLLAQCLSETQQLLQILLDHKDPGVQRLAAKAQLRISYHLVHSSDTSPSSEIRNLALWHSDLARRLLDNQELLDLQRQRSTVVRR